MYNSTNDSLGVFLFILSIAIPLLLIAMILKTYFRIGDIAANTEELVKLQRQQNKHLPAKPHPVPNPPERDPNYVADDTGFL